MSFCLADRWMKESRNPHTSNRSDQIGEEKKRGPLPPLYIPPPALPPTQSSSNRPMASITLSFLVCRSSICSRFQIFSGLFCLVKMCSIFWLQLFYAKPCRFLHPSLLLGDLFLGSLRLWTADAVFGFVFYPCAYDLAFSLYVHLFRYNTILSCFPSGKPGSFLFFSPLPFSYE